MKIVDLASKYKNDYFTCFEDWSDEMVEAGEYKKNVWLEKKKKEGLRVKLAREENGNIVGMIHYVPIEKAPVIGKDLFYIYCIWVHGYKQGVGNYQGKGIGRALLKAAEEDIRNRGAKGVVAWGIVLPFFMRSKWFKKEGYHKVDNDGMLELVWKPFTEDAVPPKLYKQKKKPGKGKGSVSITCIRNGWCPAQNLAVERVKRAIAEYEDKISYLEIDTEDREKLEEWGISDAVFVDGKNIVAGPPPGYKSIKKFIDKRVKALG